MFLAIDLGNTNLVLGVFKDNQLKHSWRVATRRDGTVDEYGLICRNLFESEKLIYSELEGVVICSVVPPLNQVIAAMCLKYLKIEQPFWVEPDEQNLMPIRYTPVTDVGAHRIVTASAAFHKFTDSTIVVDFGTATTFDAISKEGEYLGGVIAPGMDISAEALWSRAARLPRIEIGLPEVVIGTSTVDSMQSGLYYGYLGLVNGILEQMQREFEVAEVIGTGGRSHSRQIEGFNHIGHWDPDLTLLGLRIFFRYFQKKYR